MPRRSSSSSRSRSSSFSNPRRSASTTARPAQTGLSNPAPSSVPATHASQPRQPGLFGQMAATAGGVAVGSSIGHVIGNGISSLFGGSSSNENVEANNQPQYAPPTQFSREQHGGASCEGDAKAFTKCMETNNNDIGSCQFYLDMLKQCQSFTSQRF